MAHSSPFSISYSDLQLSRCLPVRFLARAVSLALAASRMIHFRPSETNVGAIVLLLSRGITLPTPPSQRLLRAARARTALAEIQWMVYASLDNGKSTTDEFVDHRWVQSTQAASPAGAGPRPSGLRYQNPNPWPRKSHTMARQLRKRPTRNRCSSRLSLLSLLSSHISTQRP